MAQLVQLGAWLVANDGLADNQIVQDHLEVGGGHLLLGVAPGTGGALVALDDETIEV